MAKKLGDYNLRLKKTEFNGQPAVQLLGEPEFFRGAIFPVLKGGNCKTCPTNEKVTFDTGKNKTIMFKTFGMEDEDLKKKIIIPFLDEVLKKISKNKLAKLYSGLDELVSAVGEAQGIATPEDLARVEQNVKDFEEKMLTAMDDEEFKKLQRAIRNTQFSGYEKGRNYTPKNAFGLYVQKPDHGVIMNETEWFIHMNRTIDKENATPLFLIAPTGTKRRKSSAERGEITKATLDKFGATKRSELHGPVDAELAAALKDKVFTPTGYYGTAVFDESDTIQIEGKEDRLAAFKAEIEGMGDGITDVSFDDSYADESVKPLYKAIADIAISTGGLNIVTVDELSPNDHNDDPNNIKVLNSASGDVNLTAELLNAMFRRIIPQQRGFKTANFNNTTVANQSALATWFVMLEFGFDVKNMPVNTKVVWGNDKTKVRNVSKAIAKLATDTVKKIKEKGVQPKGGEELTENEGAWIVTPEEVADKLGVLDIYQQQERQEELTEALRRGVANF
jgi:hypothetical protein